MAAEWSHGAGLNELGERICILGPSNSGKSTLADAVARSRGLPPVHLDQLHHLPGTDWRPRSPADFLTLHDDAIAAPRWVMDGNYSSCLPRRLDRATGVILLDLPAGVSLYRYVRRSWLDRGRHGGLDGGRDSVTWDMIRHILLTTPANRKRYAALFAELALPKLALSDAVSLDRFYAREDLSRRRARG